MFAALSSHSGGRSGLGKGARGGIVPGFVFPIACDKVAWTAEVSVQYCARCVRAQWAVRSSTPPRTSPRRYPGRRWPIAVEYRLPLRCRLHARASLLTVSLLAKCRYLIRLAPRTRRWMGIYTVHRERDCPKIEQIEITPAAAIRSVMGVRLPRSPAPSPCKHAMAPLVRDENGSPCLRQEPELGTPQFKAPICRCRAEVLQLKQSREPWRRVIAGLECADSSRRSSHKRCRREWTDDN